MRAISVHEWRQPRSCIKGSNTSQCSVILYKWRNLHPNVSALFGRESSSLMQSVCCLIPDVFILRLCLLLIVWNAHLMRTLVLNKFRLWHIVSSWTLTRRMLFWCLKFSLMRWYQQFYCVWVAQFEASPCFSHRVQSVLACLTNASTILLQGFWE